MTGVVTRFLRLLDLTAASAVVMCMAVMVVVVSAQVFMRYVLNSSLDWADEISRLAFVSAVFMAIPLGLREGAHIGISILTQYLPARQQDLLRRLLCLVAAVMLAIVFHKAALVAILTSSERLGTIRVTSSVFFIPIIIGIFHSLVHMIWLALGPAPDPDSTRCADQGLR